MVPTQIKCWSGFSATNASYARESSPTANGFHEGGDSAGDLGTNDFTTFPNGVYDLELIVHGGGGQTATTNRFILNSQLKIGQFSFSEQDLSLPVNGIPITITRTYNSQNPNSADFGYGWTFALNSMNVQLDEERQNVVPYNDFGGGVPQPVSVRTGGDWDVTLTLPNGQPATFAFSLPETSETFDSCNPQWNAPPWVHATLTPPPSDSGYDTIWFVPWVYWAETDTLGDNSPIENQDFPGWVLTTSDGTQYYITRGSPNTVTIPDPSGASIFARVYGPPALTSIVERSGDTIVINSNSIAHLAPNNTNTCSVTFNRDGQGRITAIYDPNSGTNGLPLVQYVYNQDTGNLIWVLKLVDRNAGTYTTNKYDYNNPNFPHYITSMENGDGVTVAENFYDNSGG